MIVMDYPAFAAMIEEELECLSACDVASNSDDFKLWWRGTFCGSTFPREWNWSEKFVNMPNVDDMARNLISAMSEVLSDEDNDGSHNGSRTNACRFRR